MTTRSLQTLSLAAIAAAGLSVTSVADTHYVSTNGLHIAPFTNWVNAATNIQAAVDAAIDGDTVLVNDGIYNTGGRTLPGYSLTNRVVITNQVAVQSINGPEVTRIVGQGPIGEAAVRGVVMYSGATLTGFTVTQGHTRTFPTIPPASPQVWGTRDRVAGGILCLSWALDHYGGGMISNCIITANRSYDDVGGVWGGVVVDSQIVGNRSGDVAGGAAFSTLRNCIVSDNVAIGGGGGAVACHISDSVLIRNSASVGGGAAYSDMQRCTVVSNTAELGGGGYDNGIVEHCLLDRNLASYGGGGLLMREDAVVRSCLIVNNVAGTGGGGIYISKDGVIENCTVVGNSAQVGGGLWWDTSEAFTVRNLILTQNEAPTNSNWGGGEGTTAHSWFEDCATWPLPRGIGNITNDPQFVNAAAGDYRLLPTSPCINAGTNQAWMVGATDLDGNPRIARGIVDMGAYEFARLEVAILTIDGDPGELGHSVPLGYGRHALPTGSIVRVKAVGHSNLWRGTRVVNTGWRGSGDVPPEGDDSRVEFTFNGDSRLTWLWDWQNRLRAYVVPRHVEPSPGTIDVSGEWFDRGATATLSANASENWSFRHWSGNVPPTNRLDNPLTVTMDRGRRIIAIFAPVGHDQQGEHNDDMDGDGMSDLAELAAGTDMCNSNDLLQMQIKGGDDAEQLLLQHGRAFATDSTQDSSIVLTWTTASGIVYRIERSTNLVDGFGPLVTNIVGTGSSYIYQEGTPALPERFYRIAVEETDF